MRLTAHQPGYLPWLGLLQKIASADAFVVFDDVQMEGSGFENRNQVLTDAGPKWLTVPVRRSLDSKLKDIEVCADQPWRRKHFRTIELAYSRSPQWARHEDWLRWLYGTEWNQLTALCHATLTYFVRHFQCDPGRTWTLSKLDLRSKGSQLVLDTCKAVGADQYIFGEMGESYADTKAFRAAGVEPLIQHYRSVPYPQTQPGFVPNLSALDLMMNVPRDQSIETMMAGGSIEAMS